MRKGNLLRRHHLVFSAILVLLGGCASVDPVSVQAQTGAPVAAQVQIASVPYDPSAPRFVVAVVPFDSAASGIISGGGSVATAPQPNAAILGALLHGGIVGGGVEAPGERHPGRIGAGVAAQLTTALSRSGNIALIDPHALVQNPDGTFSCKLAPGEVGPFIVRGTVTEFNETAEKSEKKRQASLGALGAATAALGALGGSGAARATGAAVAIANPTWERKAVRRKGSVTLDLQLVDGRRARIVSAFNASGTFVTASQTSGMSVFGIGGGDAEFAASALGQATRAAMNEAVMQVTQSLLSRRGELRP